MKVSKAISSDQYGDNPLKNLAEEKLAEINKAYDMIKIIMKEILHIIHHLMDIVRSYNSYGNNSVFAEVKINTK